MNPQSSLRDSACWAPHEPSTSYWAKLMLSLRDDPRPSPNVSRTRVLALHLALLCHRHLSSTDRASRGECVYGETKAESNGVPHSGHRGVV